MPTKLPTAFRLDGRTVDSVRSEHQRCQAAEPAFSNGESCFGQAMLARHAFASGFIHKLCPLNVNGSGNPQYAPSASGRFPGFTGQSRSEISDLKVVFYLQRSLYIAYIYSLHTPPLYTFQDHCFTPFISFSRVPLTILYNLYILYTLLYRHINSVGTLIKQSRVRTS